MQYNYISPIHLHGPLCTILTYSYNVNDTTDFDPGSFVINKITTDPDNHVHFYYQFICFSSFKGFPVKATEKILHFQ